MTSSPTRDTAGHCPAVHPIEFGHPFFFHSSHITPNSYPARQVDTGLQTYFWVKINFFSSSVKQIVNAILWIIQVPSSNVSQLDYTKTDDLDSWCLDVLPWPIEIKEMYFHFNFARKFWIINLRSLVISDFAPWSVFTRACCLPLLLSGIEIGLTEGRSSSNSCLSFTSMHGLSPLSSTVIVKMVNCGTDEKQHDHWLVIDQSPNKLLCWLVTKWRRIDFIILVFFVSLYFWAITSIIFSLVLGTAWWGLWWTSRLTWFSPHWRWTSPVLIFHIFLHKSKIRGLDLELCKLGRRNSINCTFQPLIKFLKASIFPIIQLFNKDERGIIIFNVLIN